MNKEAVYRLRKPSRIVIRKGGSTLFLEPEQVDWIESNGQYIFFHCGDETYDVRESISQVEQNLPSTFVRIHRSAIINTERIREIRAWFRGDAKVVLMNGTELMCSRNYKSNLDHVIQPESAEVGVR